MAKTLGGNDGKLLSSPWVETSKATITTSLRDEVCWYERKLYIA